VAAAVAEGAAAGVAVDVDDDNVELLLLLLLLVLLLVLVLEEQVWDAQLETLLLLPPLLLPALALWGSPTRQTAVTAARATCCCDASRQPCRGTDGNHTSSTRQSITMSNGGEGRPRPGERARTRRDDRSRSIVSVVLQWTAVRCHDDVRVREHGDVIDVSSCL
jgi:hypothetical protein